MTDKIKKRDLFTLGYESRIEFLLDSRIEHQTFECTVLETGAILKYEFPALKYFGTPSYIKTLYLREVVENALKEEFSKDLLYEDFGHKSEVIGKLEFVYLDENSLKIHGVLFDSKITKGIDNFYIRPFATGSYETVKILGEHVRIISEYKINNFVIVPKDV